MDMSSHATSAAGASPAAVQTEYAHFCRWLRAFFAQHPAPEGIHAIRVFNAAFKAGYTRAGKHLFQAARDGTLKKLGFNRFILAT